MAPWGVQLSSDYGRGMILGHPAVGSRDGPWGACPHPERGQSAATLRRGLATHLLRLRYWRKHKGQLPAGGSATGSEQGSDAQPRLEASARNKIQCVKCLALARSALD